MNNTTAICGHYTIAIGAPGSIARRECESGLCFGCGKERTVVYTSAPVGYDGFGTKIVKGFCGEINGRRLRAVSIEQEHFEWQTQRYLSGPNESISVEWYVKWCDNGMIVDFS